MENDLRPKTFSEYIGQKKIISTLKLFVEGVKKRGYPSEHLLFYGPPGIGKTTLANVIAFELKGEIKITSGAALTKGADLAAILTNLKNNDVLFIDEIHRLPKPVEELLYPVMEDYHLDIIVGKGPSARTVRLPVPKITIIGATTKLALLSAPLRNRFGLILRLDYYEIDDLTKIIKRTCQFYQLPIDNQAITEISRRARGTPRIANHLIKRVRDFYESKKDKKTIDVKTVKELFNMLEIDEFGLNTIDLKYLQIIGKKFQNQPVGLDTISYSLSEDKKTIEEFIEPYLLRLGLVKKTTRGRILTIKGLRHLGLLSNSML
jgi:Holliday junction DNA helicase RuvB